jgi:hypothetical protein
VVAAADLVRAPVVREERRVAFCFGLHFLQREVRSGHCVRRHRRRGKSLLGVKACWVEGRERCGARQSHGAERESREGFPGETDDVKRLQESHHRTTGAKPFWNILQNSSQFQSLFRSWDHEAGFMPWGHGKGGRMPQLRQPRGRPLETLSRSPSVCTAHWDQEDVKIGSY